MSILGRFYQMIGRPPKNLYPLDVHYQKLKVEMLATLRTLKLAA